MGDKGLNCIACHNFNGKTSPGLKGIDLLNSFERLQPSWFVHFMKNPQQYRPGIVMPNYWPGGEAVRKDVLEGNADEQVRALWHYFSLGRSARDPSGIRSVGTDLKVTDRVRVYRGRSRIAGYRGIAVGFPGGLKDRKSTRLNSSHKPISYAVFCLKKKKKKHLSLADRSHISDPSSQFVHIFY